MNLPRTRYETMIVKTDSMPYALGCYIIFDIRLLLQPAATMNHDRLYPVVYRARQALGEQRIFGIWNWLWRRWGVRCVGINKL